MQRRILIFLFLILPLAWLSTARADVYECKDDLGRINYTDKPCEGGKLVTVTPGNTMPGEAIQQRPGEPPAQPYAYESLIITSPKQDSYFRVNRPMEVSLKLFPALQGGHRMRLVLNGKPYKGRVSSSGATVKLPGEGDIAIKAQVVDRAMKLLIESAPVTIHVLPRHMPYSKTPDIDSGDPDIPDTPTAPLKPQQAVPAPRAPGIKKLPSIPPPTGN
jgi:hypothetical protein